MLGVYTPYTQQLHVPLIADKLRARYARIEFRLAAKEYLKAEEIATPQSSIHPPAIVFTLNLPYDIIKFDNSICSIESRSRRGYRFTHGPSQCFQSSLWSHPGRRLQPQDQLHMPKALQKREPI